MDADANSGLGGGASGDAPSKVSTPADRRRPKGPAVLVVSDVEGFLGAFSSAEAATEALRPYPSTVCVGAWYPCPSEASARTGAAIYPVPLRGSAALAFVASDLDEARRRHAALRAVDHVYDDDVIFWEQVVGPIHLLAARRLAEREARAARERAGPEAEAAQASKDTKKVADFLATAERDDMPGGAACCKAAPSEIAPRPEYSILSGVVDV